MQPDVKRRPDPQRNSGQQPPHARPLRHLPQPLHGRLHLRGRGALAESGQIALIIAIAIAIFVLLATRLGNRSVKKG